MLFRPDVVILSSQNFVFLQEGRVWLQSFCVTYWNAALQREGIELDQDNSISPIIPTAKVAFVPSDCSRFLCLKTPSACLWLCVAERLKQSLMPLSPHGIHLVWSRVQNLGFGYLRLHQLWACTGSNPTCRVQRGSPRLEGLGAGASSSAVNQAQVLLSRAGNVCEHCQDVRVLRFYILMTEGSYQTETPVIETLIEEMVWAGELENDHVISVIPVPL